MISRRQFVFSAAFAAPFLMASIPRAFAGRKVADLGDYGTLQDAIDTGMPVYVPPKAWDVMPVVVDNTTTVFGEWTSSLLRFGGNTHAIQPADPTKPTALCRFHDLQIAAASKVAGQHGVHMPSCWHWDFRRVSIKDFGGTGWNVWGQRDENGNRAPADSTKSRWDHCRSVRNRMGWVLDGTPGAGRDDISTMGTANMHHLSHCLASQSEVFGFYIDQGAANLLDHCIADLSGNHGVVMAWYGNEAVRLTAEHSGGYGVYFTSHATTHSNRVSMHSGGANTNGAHNASGTNVVV